MGNEVKLVLKDSQIHTAIAALDLFFRIYLGQYDAIDMLYLWSWDTDLYYDHNVDEARDVLMVPIRNALMPDMMSSGFGGSRGIYNKLNPPDCMDAYNLMCSIRSAYAWYRDPICTFATVDYRPPTKKGRYCPATCVIEKKEEAAVANLTMCKEQYELLLTAARVYLDVLTGMLRDAFGVFTQDPELLALAEEAEQYHPEHLNKRTLSNAENLLQLLRITAGLNAAQEGRGRNGADTTPRRNR
ncbi:MAG: hypothetical protein K6C08_04355 [Oscillospiraceae bacterium]|nr:hypothetical protein [Oscillospiraceae bacterium]